MDAQSPDVRLEGKQKSHRRIWVAIVVITLIPVCLIGGCAAIPLMVIYQADQGFKHAKKNINPETLRTWALQTIATNSAMATNSYAIILPHKLISTTVPEAILHMYSDPPESVCITPTWSGQPGKIDIAWGGGFFHWWLRISDTNFSEPYKSDNPEYPYNFEWVPGIYYTREAAWPLL